MKKVVSLISILVLAISVAFIISPPVAGFPIDWRNLYNPILQYGNWSIEDFAVEYKDGTFYVFFSAFYDDNGRIRSHVVEVSTLDFKSYSSPIINFDGEEAGWNGMTSPSITKIGTTYYLIFNSWRGKSGANRFFYKTSTDLLNWSSGYSPLAAHLNTGVKSTDAAVAYANNKIYLAYNRNQTPKMAVGSSMDAKDFIHIPNYNVTDQENFQFLYVDNKWRMVTNNISNHIPRVYTMTGSGANDSDWADWGSYYNILTTPRESFNTYLRANTAFIVDWRSFDGNFYLFYAGNTEISSYGGRGWNRMGISRNTILLNYNWKVPGPSPTIGFTPTPTPHPITNLGSYKTADSGNWDTVTNDVSKLYDGKTYTSAVAPNTDSAWIEFTFPTNKTFRMAHLYGDNSGSDNSGTWTLQSWNGSNYTDIFTNLNCRAPNGTPSNLDSLRTGSG